MAGKIIADQLQNTTVGTLDTKWIIEGSAKSWCRFSQAGSHSFVDSWNYSSITDESVGVSVVNLTNSMTSSNYAIWTHDWSYGNGWSDSMSTNSYKCRRRNESAAYLDVTVVWSSVIGDIA